MKSTAQQRSWAQQEQRWQLHSRCECEVRQRGPHWGVYCATHNKWIQWIDKTQAQQIAKITC